MSVDESLLCSFQVSYLHNLGSHQESLSIFTEFDLALTILKLDPETSGKETKVRLRWQQTRHSSSEAETEEVVHHTQMNSYELPVQQVRASIDLPAIIKRPLDHQQRISFEKSNLVISTDIISLPPFSAVTGPFNPTLYYKLCFRPPIPSFDTNFVFPDPRFTSHDDENPSWRVCSFSAALKRLMDGTGLM